MYTKDGGKPHIAVTRKIFSEVMAELEKYFEVTANKRQKPWTRNELIENCRDVDGVMTFGVERIDATLLEQCRNIRICSNISAGYDNFDVEAMRKRGVTATNVPDLVTVTAADHAFALMFGVARRITEAERYLRSGKWSTWNYDVLLGQEITNSCLGIVGMGRIGKAIAQRASAGFHMDVVYHSRRKVDFVNESYQYSRIPRQVSLLDLLSIADVVVITTPLNENTFHLIDRNELTHMKKSAILINISRGGVVNDQALAEALGDKRIWGAGLDVYENEPRISTEFLKLDNVVLTPHIGSATYATRRAIIARAAENLRRFFYEGAAIDVI